jgi:transcriptional regulator with XRE-family HTH domain
VNPSLELGALLRELREKAGLTRRELALRAGYKHPYMVARIEDGVAGLTPKRFEIMVEALGEWGEYLRMRQPRDPLDRLLIERGVLK